MDRQRVVFGGLIAFGGFYEKRVFDFEVIRGDASLGQAHL